MNWLSELDGMALQARFGSREYFVDPCAKTSRTTD